VLKAFDADDWIYQTWAYEKHDVGTTPGFNGDTEKALASIKARPQAGRHCLCFLPCGGSNKRT
jgi:homoserine acetyltransferase